MEGDEKGTFKAAATNTALCVLFSIRVSGDFIAQQYEDVNIVLYFSRLA